MPDQNFDPEGYNLEDMAEEQKDQLILQLANEYNASLALNVELHNAMTRVAAFMVDNNRFRYRDRVIKDAAVRLSMIAAITRLRLGIDMEQQRTNDTFEDIVAGLDLQEPTDD